MKHHCPVNDCRCRARATRTHSRRTSGTCNPHSCCVSSRLQRLLFDHSHASLHWGCVCSSLGPGATQKLHSFTLCRIWHPLRKLDSVPPLRHEWPLEEGANSYRHGGEVSSKSPEHHTVAYRVGQYFQWSLCSSRCHTRRSLPLGPCARRGTSVSRRDPSGNIGIAAIVYNPYVHHGCPTHLKIDLASFNSCYLASIDEPVVCYSD